MLQIQDTRPFIQLDNYLYTCERWAGNGLCISSPLSMSTLLTTNIKDPVAVGRSLFPTQADCASSLKALNSSDFCVRVVVPKDVTEVIGPNHPYWAVIDARIDAYEKEYGIGPYKNVHSASSTSILRSSIPLLIISLGFRL